MPSCKPRTLSPGNSFVPNAAFLRAAGENSTRATGPPGGRAGADRARQVPPAGGVLAVGFAAPQRSDPERSRQREARGPRMAGAPGGAGCGTSRAPGTGTWAGRRAPRLPVSPPSLRPAPTPSPRHLSPHLSLASRPAVRASAGAFPPPGSRHLTCGCSPRPPAEPRARQPSRPRATRRGGSSHGALRMQTPRHVHILPPSAYGPRDGSRAQVKPVTLSRANLGSRNPHL